MSAPDSTSGALRVGPGARLPSGGLAWWSLALIAAVVTAQLTMASIQMGCTAALLVLTVGLYVRNRTAGLVAMWLTWLLAPLIRRIFFLSEPAQGEDPLALAPFLVTAAIVVLELTEVELSSRSRRVLMLIAGGYVLGIPIGLLVAPAAALFALFAYLTAVGCFVLGYREGESRRLVLPSLLMIAAPLLALYAIRQYYLPLPEWDEVWRTTADIGSTGSPDGSRIRAWGTLNSPATFATVMGVALVAYVTLARVRPWQLAGALAVFAGLALTYVRSAWVAVPIALIAVVLVTRGAAVKRVGSVALVLVALGPIALSGSTETALTKRVDTFGSLGQDKSTAERTTASLVVAPRALLLPLGEGLGQAGEATRLSGAGGGFRYTDSAYLSLLFQTGPFGFLLVMVGVVVALRSAARNAWRRRDSRDVMAFGVLVFLAVIMLAGDHLYGVGGMIFWYTTGLAMRRSESTEPTNRLSVK